MFVNYHILNNSSRQSSSSLNAWIPTCTGLCFCDVNRDTFSIRIVLSNTTSLFSNCYTVPLAKKIILYVLKKILWLVINIAEK